MSYKNLCIKYNVEWDIRKRWEEGINHHLKSQRLMFDIAEIDFELMDDHFCWKYGGDGDNGEALMYLLDIYFELEDRLNYIAGII